MITSTYVKSKKQYKVSFELAQERVGENRDVRVLGTFNDWSWDNGIKLKSGKKGYTGETQLPTGTYQFRYLVDGHHWVNDDTAETYTDSGHGSTNCSFTLEEVKEDKKKPAAKKTTTKKEEGTKMEAAKSAPATKPVVDPKAEKQKAEQQTAAKQDSDTASGTKKAAAKKPTAKKPAAKKPAAKKTPAKKDTKKSDDLKKIEGIGPKIAGLLNEAGINTFSDLAKATEKQLADVLQEAGARFRLAKHDTWSEQAQLAADGKTDELKKLQDSLKGGKK